jgi:hypothetical protein
LRASAARLLRRSPRHASNSSDSKNEVTEPVRTRCSCSWPPSGSCY